MPPPYRFSLNKICQINLIHYQPIQQFPHLRWFNRHRLHNTHFPSCKPLTKILEGPGYPKLDAFPISQYVTYRYYTGRLHIFDGNYAEAEKDLEVCFQRCIASATRNKRKALMFLVPAKLMRGKIPPKQLLSKYGLQEYQGISEAVRTGNLAQYNDAFVKHEALFRKRGLYLLLEKLKWLVYRTLFKRCYLIKTQNGSKGPPVIPLDVLGQGLALCKVEMEMEEIECIVANLVFQKYIRGYMAHKKDKTFLILSKNNPFPKLSDVSPE